MWLIRFIKKLIFFAIGLLIIAGLAAVFIGSF